MTRNNWQRLHDAGKRELAALKRSFLSPRKAQEALLSAILEREGTGHFGIAHDFASISGPDDFRGRVPIGGYDSYRPWIDSICRGQHSALTASAPLCFEQTGGSSGGRKLIPYTVPGLDSFRRSVLSWIADLLDHDPAIADGRAYFATSPAVRSVRQSEGGLPVGLANDAAYFGEDLMADVTAILTGARELTGLSDFDEWQTATLAWLAATKNLTLISVWSPTFLSTLIDAMERNPEPILRALHNGEHGLPSLPNRANELAASLAPGRLDTAMLWPALRLVSAWADGGSARFADDLAARIPNAIFQPKGLLATEGVFTLPLREAPFPVPALTSTFLEFEDDSGGLHLVDELDPGATYQTIATTPGGLYRYRIGDRIRCEDFLSGGRSIPLLSFAGRASDTSDLVGEKLEEGFAAGCLARCVPGFAALAACGEPKPHYVLITGPCGENRADAVDQALMENPLYRDARQIGQLGALGILAVEDPVHRYQAWRMSRGDRLGDIKIPVLFGDISEVHRIWP